ncbi:MAG: DUF2207 domain-containing protein, partial [Gammaproteobacteria bacterium]|nr:DUF2207 domain-containing protein [Gammaproteobacteria bacterium]
EVEGYTGVSGLQGAAYSAGVDDEGVARFSTTAPLRPKEGLTIAVSWPKGHVEEPSTADKAKYFVRDNLGMATGVVGFVSVMIYYFVIWFKVGRDPPGGVIVPAYAPPQELSPAAARFVMRMGFDHGAFTAALINGAVKGHVMIEQEDRKYRLSKRNDGHRDELSRGETRVLAKLFAGGNSLELVRRNHKRVSDAIKVLKKTLRAEYQRVYFFANRGYLIPGITLSAVAVIGSGIAAGADGFAMIFLTVWLTIWTGAVVLLWMQRSILIALVFSSFELIAMAVFSQQLPGWSFAVLLGLLAVNVFFYQLLKAPTRLGRKVMDKIEGLKMYLELAEKDRLDLLNPPERTPQLFEELLPYALALGVEQQWSQRFAGVLAGAAAGGNDYRPAWYQGAHTDVLSPAQFSSSLGSSLTSAIGSSAHASGSSSGVGGGGSSGGGGGGGGGGGW